MIYNRPKKYDPEELKLEIIYEDEDLLIINKQTGMVTHPAPGNHSYTLVNALLYHTKNNLSSVNDSNRPGIVHRLDKDTSGLLVIAKNNLSHVDLAKQFKKHSITRKYYAIVWGVPQNQIIKGYIQRHKTNRKKMTLNKLNNGKYSETSIKIIQSFGICSLIECTLKTGRTHQVRVHMNSIHYPLIGDKLYGKNKVSSYAKDKKNFKIKRGYYYQPLINQILKFYFHNKLYYDPRQEFLPIIGWKNNIPVLDPAMYGICISRNFCSRPRPFVWRRFFQKTIES